MRASTPIARRENSNLGSAFGGAAQAMTHSTKHTVKATAFLALAAVWATACRAPETPSARPESAGTEATAPAGERPAPAATASAAPAGSATPAVPAASSAQTASSDPAARTAPAAQAPPVAAKPAAALERFEILVPGTTAKLALAPIPAGELAHADGTRAAVGPFFASTTEITWDMYDAFVFAMERAENETDPPDAYARPSKPYILMDRGFGHAGYPVISVSFRGATEFCRWLSAKTGKRFRLPTENEWEHAARGGSQGAYTHGDDPAALEANAWYAANSKARGRSSTRTVGKKAANAYGLHDVHGNAAEWTVGADGKGVLRGGSFKDPADKLGLVARLPDDPAFNATDPQVPKSVWWLADGAFAGFRVVCDP